MVESEESPLQVKMTLDEYLYEMSNYDTLIQTHPSKTDPTDPLYRKKYAHNMPPLIVYKSRMVGMEHVNVPGNDNNRRLFYGWNNMTDHERQGVEKLRQWLLKEKNCQVPDGFDKKDLLKYVQANFFQIDKAGEKIFAHFAWLRSLPTVPTLNKTTIKMLQEGAFYILGRDKFYRPCLIIDCTVMASLASKDPQCASEQTIQDVFIFLFQYITQVMFIKGHVEQWTSIINLGNLGMTSIPRK